jgi:hypothetical protein
MTDTRCPHGDREHRCPTCCLLALRKYMPALDRAVSIRDKAPGSGPRPAFGSREPINTSAFALLQDINRAGGLNTVEHHLHVLRDPELRGLERNVRQWRSRASLILRLATAPYPVLWPTLVPVVRAGKPVLDGRGQPRLELRDRPVPCPVVLEEGDCAAPLRVHRDDDPESPSFTRPELIRCARYEDHEWTLAHGGWLRLGSLLGGQLGGAA